MTRTLPPSDYKDASYYLTQQGHYHRRRAGEMDNHENPKRKAAGTWGAKAEVAPGPEKVDDDRY